ncbi:MAG: hypothetical protein ACTTH8_00310 [Treponema sp.]
MSEVYNKKNGKKYDKTSDDSNFGRNHGGHKHRRPAFADVYECARCGKPIKELSAALADKSDGKPVHFDCVLNYLQETEPLHEGETITYIGQGRFAVIKYVSQVIMKDFSIIRIIEWEDKNKRAEWRGEIADLFSRIE